MKDDSLDARAFVYPLFFSILVLSVAAIACTSVRSDRSAGIVLSSFCIHCYYLNSAATGLEQRLPRLSRTDYLFCATGLGVALLIMLPLHWKPEFGPTITQPSENYQSFCLEVVQPSL